MHICEYYGCILVNTLCGIIGNGHLEQLRIHEFMSISTGCVTYKSANIDMWSRKLNQCVKAYTINSWIDEHFYRLNNLQAANLYMYTLEFGGCKMLHGTRHYNCNVKWQYPQEWRSNMSMNYSRSQSWTKLYQSELTEELEEKLFSWCRHGKYEEIKYLFNAPT